MIELLGDVEQHEFAYLTTTGRVSGHAHRIEIWFAVLDGRLYMAAGGRRGADWVRNVEADPAVTLEIGDERWAAAGTVLDDADDHPARARLAARYQGWRPGQPLSDWATSALLVGFEVESPA